MVCCVVGAAPLAVAQGPTGAPRPPRDLSIQELLNQCATLLGSGRYAEAVPYLEQYVSSLETLAADESQRALEMALLQLALAYLEADRAQDCVATTERYLNKFPQGGQRTGMLLLRADALTTVEDWAGVITTGEALAKETGLGMIELLSLNQLLGEAYFRTQRWGAAAGPLHYVFRNSREQATRTDAAAKVAICLVRAKQLEELFQFLPEAMATPARYDVRLALTLAEGGDEHYDAGQYGPALLLYRLVYSKAELLEQIKGRIAETRRMRDNAASLPGVDRTRIAAVRRQLDRQVTQLTEELAELEEVDEYVQGLLIRIGRTYLQTRRNWEALLTFQSLFDDYPEHPLAEEGLYSAFTTALLMNEADRAILAGRTHMETFVGGQFWEPLTLNLAQLYVQRQDWEAGRAVGRRALEVRPDHVNADHVLYLLGFCDFHLEEFPAALTSFAAIYERFPESFFVESARYWHAMTQMFHNDYPAARDEFERFIVAFKDGQYFEDALYRTGVAQYGAGDFDAAAITMRRFVATFPTGELVSEALAMLGDIHAARGDLDVAITQYQQAIREAKTLVQINYGTFQMARVYELERRWDEIIALFTEYLQRHDAAGNITEATYWIGNAYLASGRTSEAMRVFFDAIVRYGNDPRQLGIDMILRDVLEATRQPAAADDARRLVQRLDDALRQSREQKRLTLELRLTALFVETLTDPAQRERLLEVILRPSNIAPAAPFTLQLMGREALRRGDTELARQVYAHFLATYPTSDLVLDALEQQAELEIRDGRLDAAAGWLEELINRFATTFEGGRAQKRLGDVRLLQGRYADAIAAYTTVLGVRDWRGELWPESLYGIGVAHLEAGQVADAFAYFQRVYVLYEGYPVWAARAYLKSAECLQRLDRHGEAANTYRELLAKPPLAAQVAEAQQARAALQQLGVTP